MKDKMISIIGCESMIKNGATNINSYSDNDNILTNDKDLLYFDYDTTYFGVQLNQNHLAEDSEVNEITQVIALISENNSTDLYKQVYNAISSIIENSINDLFPENRVEESQKIKFVKNFINTFKNANKNATGKEVLEILKSETSLLIPFSDSSFYKSFIASVINQLNTNFIRRKFKGIGLTLNPSHGYVQVYEDINGNTYNTEDIVKLYNSEYKSDEILLTKKTDYDRFSHKIQYVLNNHPLFKDTLIYLETISPLDIIKVYDKDNNFLEEVNLTSIDDYYSFKEKYKSFNNTYFKVNNKSRDLAPAKF